MDESITIGGITIPRADWEKTPESVKNVVRNQEQRIAAIEERLGLNASNSSIPPSKQPPQAKEKKQEKGGRRKRGGQKGHKGFTRHLYEPSECSEIIDHQPETCKHCQAPLTGEDSQPYRHQIVEIPPVAPVVTEHRLHALTCGCCGQTTRAELPDGINSSGYGERLQSLVALLSGAYRLSHNQVKTLMRDLWQVNLSTGTVNRIRQRVSQKLSQVVNEARSYIMASGTAYVDETSWSQNNGDGNNPENASAWLWTAVSDNVAVYQVTLNRARSSALSLLGKNYTGLVVSDRYSVYNGWTVEQRQVCWAHLKRDFKRMAERSGASKEIGEALLKQTKRLFHWWHRVRDGTLSTELFQAAMARLRQSVHHLLSEAASLCHSSREQTPLAKTARTCQQILNLEPALWKFVEVNAVEPTNNTAERALRTAVIWRDLSYGSWSRSGSEFVERLLTVVMSLRLQERPVLEFLIQVLHSEPVSLLPLPPE